MPTYCPSVRTAPPGASAGAGGATGSDYSYVSPRILELLEQSPGNLDCLDQAHLHRWCCQSYGLTILAEIVTSAHTRDPAGFLPSCRTTPPAASTVETSGSGSDPSRATLNRTQEECKGRSQCFMRCVAIPMIWLLWQKCIELTIDPAG